MKHDTRRRTEAGTAAGPGLGVLRDQGYVAAPWRDPMTHRPVGPTHEDEAANAARPDRACEGGDFRAHASSCCPVSSLRGGVLCTPGAATPCPPQGSRPHRGHAGQSGQEKSSPGGQAPANTPLSWSPVFKPPHCDPPASSHVPCGSVRRKSSSFPGAGLPPSTPGPSL